MPSVEKSPLPEHALHAGYAQDGAYTDCYSTVVQGKFTQGQFVEAFYTTWLFKLERWILGWAVKRPSNDAQARWVAFGDINYFAAWTVEAREPDQLLMCDLFGHTRSWFMTVPLSEGDTRLYFGSVVTARVNKDTGKRELGRSYRVLMGFHKLYSRALLSAARSRLGRR